MSTTEKHEVKGRLTNAAYREREYLFPAEVKALIETARRRSRHGHRDATMILLCYRHGLRVGELCNLKWSQVNFVDAIISVKRLKNSRDGNHPLQGDSLRALRKLRREVDDPFLFLSERGGPISPQGFRDNLKRLGTLATLPFPVHPHMLRHSTGYKLANSGTDTRTIQHYFGHKNIQNTVRYTELDASRFNDLWEG